MKRDLIELIKSIPEIEAKFKRFEPSDGLCIPSGDFIYDNPDFIKWKEAVEFELQQIYERTSNPYVGNLINGTGVIHKFNGKNHNERYYFNQLKYSLYMIQKNISEYFPNEDAEEREENEMLKPKIFISHSSADLKYIEPFVELLADIGLSNDNLFCPSVPDYSIPLSQDIYEYLSSLFSEHKLYVIFMLSDNYYKSTACLNEMGAAWVLKKEYISVLLPSFAYQEIKGAVNPNKINLRLDDNEELLKKKLGDLKNIVSEEFGISVPDMRWENKRNDFINTIKSLWQIAEE